MPTYFKPLRRKIGVVTLLLSCVFAGAWVRSLSVTDYFVFTTGKGIEDFDHWSSCVGWSSNGVLILVQYPFPKIDTNLMPANEWGFVLSDQNGVNLGESHLDFDLTDADLEWHWRQFGFGFGVFRPGKGAIWSISYWPMIVTFAPLALYLTLSRPRAKTEPRVPN